MTIAFKDDAGVDHEISEIWFMDADGVDREISTVLFGPKVVFSPGTTDLSVVVAPPSVEGDAGGSGFAITDATTATPSGGVAPYTYLWTLEDVEGSPAITNPTSATTTFYASGILLGTYWGGTAHCLVTDGNGATASDACIVTLFGGPT